MSEQDNAHTQRSGGHRRHMGTATADPSYLPLTPQEQARERAYARERMQHGNVREQAGAPAHSLRHSDRYLQTPKPGHSIFTSQRQRRARRARTMIAVVALLAIALALVWFFFLR